MRPTGGTDNERGGSILLLSLNESAQGACGGEQAFPIMEPRLHGVGNESSRTSSFLPRRARVDMRLLPVSQSRSAGGRVVSPSFLHLTSRLSRRRLAVGIPIFHGSQHRFPMVGDVCIAAEIMTDETDLLPTHVREVRLFFLRSIDAVGEIPRGPF